MSVSATTTNAVRSAPPAEVEVMVLVLFAHVAQPSSPPPLMPMVYHLANPGVTQYHRVHVKRQAASEAPVKAFTVPSWRRAFALEGSFLKPGLLLHAPRLRMLDCSEWPHFASLPDLGLRFLHTIQFADCSVSDEHFSSLARLRTLRTLTATGCMQLRAVGAALATSTTLTSIDFTMSRQVCIDGLECIPTLRELNVTGCYVNSLVNLVKSRSLERLVARRTWIGDDGIAGLGSIPTLTELDLRGESATVLHLEAVIERTTAWVRIGIDEGRLSAKASRSLMQLPTFLGFL